MASQNSTSGDSTSGDGQSWRVIASDGSWKPAPHRDQPALDSGGDDRPRAFFRGIGIDRARGGDEAIEPLVDVLHDEELTLLDLDLMSADISRLAAPLIAAPRGDETLDEPADDGDGELAQVIDAWPQLPADLRRAIVLIARGGARS